MSDERAVAIARELHLLGVSQAGVVELLTQYPPDRIERQLSYLPFRKAKRPEAFIIEAIRSNYSAPKDYFYAKAETLTPHPEPLLDQGPKHPLRQADADSERHGAPGAPGEHSGNIGMEPGWKNIDLVLPAANETYGPAQ